MTASEWDAHATDWDANEDVRVYSEKAFESWKSRVVPLVAELSKSRVLDFGCGTGLLTKKIATHCGHVVAVDTSPKMIEVLNRKVLQMGIENVVGLNIAINAETIRNNPVLANQFDLVVASSVCSFLPDYEATLRELSTILSPGAYFVQWDWMADMPAQRIRSAFKASGIIEQYVDQAFAMTLEGESMPVVMGIGQLRFR